VAAIDRIDPGHSRREHLRLPLCDAVELHLVKGDLVRYIRFRGLDSSDYF
jgi:hypothetical protein